MLQKQNAIVILKKNQNFSYNIEDKNIFQKKFEFKIKIPKSHFETTKIKINFLNIFQL